MSNHITNFSANGTLNQVTTQQSNNILLAAGGLVPVRGNSGSSLNNLVDPYVPTVFGEVCQDVYVQEKHVSVIRKGPTAPPSLEMFSYTREDANGNGFIDIKTQFTGDTATYVNTSLENISIFFKDNNDRKVAGDTVVLPILDIDQDWKSGDVVNITLEYFNSLSIKQKASCRVALTGIPDPALGLPPASINGTLLTNTVGFPLITDVYDEYECELEQEDPMFELKFPKFAYRYKFEDGEYSIFSPWSQIAFIPDEFDYMPKKGYNLGMTNRMRSLKIMDWVPKNIPKDVVQVDLLYKQSNSPNVYTVESFKEDDVVTNVILGTNPWNTPGNGKNHGSYVVTSELIHATVASNQMLRPWDNVPRVALGQEITANRLVFANYIQNYDTLDDLGAEIKPIFNVSADAYLDISTQPELARLPGKSLKSMRSYQLGVVYRDRYGRETPVLTSETGTFKVKKENAKNYSKINVGLSSQAPDWAESFTIYIKETSNEYYNLAIDRWYDAEDGGVWVSFPSSERNKIDDETVLYLKKQHDTDIPVETEIEYKVISIKNSAPTFIKTDKQYWGGVDMMLPPAGWGMNGRPGSWQSGMFGSTGLPLPGRLFLDVYAEYAEQTILEGIKSMNRDGLQVRITQGAGQLTSYVGGGANSTNKSDWYDVSRVSFIGEEPAVYTESYTNPSTGITTEVELEEPNAKHPLIRITLEKVMGNDMAFAEPRDNLDLARGLSLEVRTSIVRDKAQFEGRFFVKLFRSNDLVRNIIQPSNPVGDILYVVESKGLKYLCDAHPGVQDWANMTPNQSPTSIPSNGSLTNFIRPGVAVSARDDAGTGIANPFNKPPGSYAELVSSYSAAAAGADLTNEVGAPITAPQNCYSGAGLVYQQLNGYNYPHSSASVEEMGCWPFGPGRGEPPFSKWKNAIGVSGVGGWTNSSGQKTWWGKRYQPHTDSNGQTRATSRIAYDWPSFFPSQYSPFQQFEAGKPAHNSTFSLRTAPQDVIGNNPSFTYSGSLGEIFQKNRGENPWMKPAIWGRDPFALSAWEQELNLDQRNAMWDATTIGNLNRDWMGYWNTGSGSNDTEWPFTRVSWDRWFIDKVGAAENYAGSGIWDDEFVSHIAISYWGIGRGDNRGPISDPHDLSYHQESELTFANSISTVGTMFRFKQDPDSTVYTITDVKVEKVFNYESFHGNWGYKDGSGNNVEPMPPFGPEKKHPSGIAGQPLFYSDVWQGDGSTDDLHRERTGRAMQNNRLRFNLTLDKKIGSGVNGFNPITNHVEPALSTHPSVIAYNVWVAAGSSGPQPGFAEGTMVCNIPTGLGVRDRVRYDKTAATHVSLEKGGTPCPLGDSLDVTSTRNSTERYAMYNLASYWNCTNASRALLDGNNGEQPNNLSDVFYTGDARTYIGLHERGLNETTIEIVEFYDGEDGTKPMSNNPGVFETEPREDVGMDLYYAASPTYPVDLKRYRFDVDNEPGWYDYGLRGEEYIKVGGSVSGPVDSAVIDGVEENKVWVNTIITLTAGDVVKFTSNGEGTYYGVRVDDNFVEGIVEEVITDKIFTIKSEVHSTQRSLGYFNCYSFGNGVESNRIRDDYNQVTIDKGVKASAPLAEGYEEERKASSFIFSGIYNSTSGINRTNEFIQAEPITKDLNPINGSIQKLFARDTDLVTFCENKVFKVLAKKDALFNADGNSNITSNQAVLGATMPFEGEYGISRNPESFASESYRVYFTDKDRGAVMRLSKSGLQPISDKGMKDWFKDNLMNASSLIGSFDTREDHYNLTIETKDQDNIDNAYTLSFTESKNGGWISFKSFITQGGISYKNKYYTFPSNNFNMASTAVGSASKVLYGDHYGGFEGQYGMAEMWQHHVDLDFHRYVSSAVSGSNQVSLNPAGIGVIVVGMNVEGNGVPIDTVVITGGFGNSVHLSNDVHVETGGELRFTAARNNFYGLQSHSMVRTMFNGDQGTVKRFKSLNYEGSQGKSLLNETVGDTYQLHLDGSTVNVGQVYSNNFAKNGWEVYEIKTDLQDGSIQEFIDKENKWFNYIRGFEDAGFGDDVDTAEFSAQGIGITNI